MSEDKNLELLPVTYTSKFDFLKKLFKTLSKLSTFWIGYNKLDRKNKEMI